MAEKIKCPSCDGDGFYTSECGENDTQLGYFTCPICNGDGEVAPQDIPRCQQCKHYTTVIPAGTPNPYVKPGVFPDGYCLKQARVIGDATEACPCKDYGFKKT